ncbi:MAG: sulfurtransferase [Candidatus Puniceispirillaceae bacterium]
MHYVQRFFFAILLWVGVATAASAQPLVEADWLSRNLDSKNVVLIDLRNKLDQGSYETFLEGHIPTSIHSDYLKDGWRVGRDDVVGLLPSEAEFQALARKLGVSQDSHVVLIPAGVSSTDFGSSARAYWTFKVFGHDKVSILNGGFAAWTAAYPNKIEQGAPIAPAAGDFIARFKPQGYISMEQVAQAVGTGSGITLLDGRNEPQYYGEAKHPKAAKAGRIPGAQMLFQETAYDVGANRLKSAADLEGLYADVAADQPVISYCNTGHWAATNWFVLSEVLGRKDVKLYDGSMVEWTANAGNPLEIGQSNMDKIKGFFKSILG